MRGSIRQGRTAEGALFSDEVSFHRTLRAYYPRGPHQPINVRLFLDFISKHMTGYRFGA